MTPIATTPATVFTGTSNIVFDGSKGASAPIAGATIALVDPVTGKPIVLTRATVPPSTANPQTTASDGSFSFLLTPAQYGHARHEQGHHLTLSATHFRNRTIQAVFTPDATGLLYSVTLTALDGQQLAAPGAFTLVAGPTTMANVLNLIGNIPMFPVGALTVQKVADKTTVSAGQRVIYTVTIEASQTFGATRIVDQLPRDSSTLRTRRRSTAWRSNRRSADSPKSGKSRR